MCTYAHMHAVGPGALVDVSGCAVWLWCRVQPHDTISTLCLPAGMWVAL